MSLPTEPLIFILDLDGTIIGDCTYQVILYNIEDICRRYKIKAKTDDMLMECYRPDSKLMRPFFKYFVSFVKKHHPHSLFYIYTASDKAWAYKEIQLIEKTHNIKFNRPIFTRDDCIADSFGQYRKSVKKILPKIIKGNKKCSILENRILIIDNNATFIDYTSNFLLCPTYNHMLFCDLWEKVRKEYMKIMDIYKLVKSLIASNKMCKYCNIGSTAAVADSKILENRHRWLYKKHKKINNLNKKYKGDIFWKTLAHTIVDKKITTFDKATLEFLQKAIA